MLGNKKDLDLQVVPTEEGIKKAEKLQAFYQEVSAKSGLNIDEFFKHLLSFLIQQSNKDSKEQIEIGKPLELTNKKQRKNCCSKQ